MNKILITVGVIFILFIIFIFAVAIQVYNSTPEIEEQKQITYNQETEKPLTRLEIKERQNVQDWKKQIEEKKKEVGR